MKSDEMTGDSDNGKQGAPDKVRPIDWRSLLAAVDFSPLLSKEYNRFSPALKAALSLFFLGLPNNAQQDLLNRLTGSPNCSLAERLGHIALSSPVLHKIAQTLARNRQLAPALRFELQKLEWLPPSVSMAQLEKVLIREIGPLVRQGIRLAPRPLAEASVAVVIPFALRGGDDPLADTDYTGVFKILKPGIEERLQLELALLPAVGESLDDRCRELNIPPIKYRETFQHVAETLAQEIRLTEEQHHLAAAAATFAGNPRVTVPRLFGPSTPRITAMERIRGVKLDPANVTSRSTRKRLADTLLRTLVIQPAFARDESTMFHADPHAGNLMYTDDNRLAVLDWSLTGTLKNSTRICINNILLAAQGHWYQRIADLIAQVSETGSTDHAWLTALVQKSLTTSCSDPVPGLSWLISLLDRVVTEGLIRLPMEMVLFRKALMTVLALIEDLTEDPRHADKLLRSEFLNQLVSEWPIRWIYPPFSRNLPSRLSTADLTEVACHSMFATSSYCLSPWG